MSNDKFVMNVGLAHQLEHAFDRNGWNVAEVNLLSQGAILTQIREVINSRAEIRLFPCDVIDCDADPLIPPRLFVKVHEKGGRITWNPGRVPLYRFENTVYNDDGYISGGIIVYKLRSKHIMNANVLDYLLKHPNWVPRDWKRKDLYIYFLGTIYFDSTTTNDNPCFRGLHWDGKEMSEVRFYYGSVLPYRGAMYFPVSEERRP